MNNNDSHTDKHLQDLFQSFEPSVPPGAWDGIAGALDRNRKRRIALWWISAAAVLLVGFMGLWMLNGEKERPNQTVQQKAIHQQQRNKVSVDDKTDKIKIEESQIADSEKRAGYENAKAGSEDVPGKIHEIKNSEIREAEPVVIKAESAFALPGNSDAALLLVPFGLHEVSIPREDAVGTRMINISKPKQFKLPLGKWMVMAGVQQMQTGNGYAVNPAFSRYVHKNYLLRMGQGEQNMGSTGFSLQLGYALNKHLAVNGGIQFRQINIRQQFNFSDEVPVTLMPGNKADKFGNYPIIGYFGSTGSVAYNGFQRNTMVEIPLGVNLDLPVAPKWSVKPSLNLNAGFFSGVSGNTLDYQQLQVVSQQLYRFRAVQFSGSLSVGAFRQLSRNLQWGTTFGGTRMFTPVYIPDASIRPRNHALGLGTQLIWRID